MKTNFEPQATLMQEASSALIEKMGVKVSFKLDEEIREADFIQVLRIQLERQEKGLFPSMPFQRNR